MCTDASAATAVATAAGAVAGMAAAKARSRLRSASAPLTLEQLVAVGFDNPLRAIGIDPAEYRRRIEGKGVERVAWREGGFVLI
jgi:hypothetical protein